MNAPMQPVLGPLAPAPTTTATAVRFRVHSLHLPSSTAVRFGGAGGGGAATAVSAVSGPFRADGLYVVLRLDHQAYRTACLVEEDREAADTPLSTQRLSAAALAEREENEEEEEESCTGTCHAAPSLTWDEVFDFSLLRPCEPSETATLIGGGGGGGSAVLSQTGGSRSGSVTPQLHHQPPPPPLSGAIPTASSSSLTTPVLGSSATGGHGALLPTIEVELWRSSHSGSEGCLARYGFCVPVELHTAATLTSGRAVGPVTAPLADLVDRVLPLQSASSYDQRLGLRVRVQVTGRSTAPTAGLAGPPAAMYSTGYYPAPGVAGSGYFTSSASATPMPDGAFHHSAGLPFFGYANSLTPLGPAHVAGGAYYPPSVLGSSYAQPMLAAGAMMGMGGGGSLTGAVMPSSSASATAVERAAGGFGGPMQLDPRLACLLSPLGLQQQALLAHTTASPPLAGGSAVGLQQQQQPVSSAWMPPVLASPVPAPLLLRRTRRRRRHRRRPLLHSHR